MTNERLVEIVTSALYDSLCHGCDKSVYDITFEDDKTCDECRARVAEVIKERLSQPEIIRCKDCKYRDENWRRVSVGWLPCMDMRTGSNWYCGSAKRGEQDGND